MMCNVDPLTKIYRERVRGNPEFVTVVSVIEGRTKLYVKGKDLFNYR